VGGGVMLGDLVAVNTTDKDFSDVDEGEMEGKTV
jgi:hypothetical protein